MTPEQFIDKWSRADRSERQAAQEHFIDLCRDELARTAIWIGNIQWLRRNGFEARKEPVLEDLEAIECRDALMTRIEP
jgi:hypothetical protein